MSIPSTRTAAVALALAAATAVTGCKPIAASVKHPGVRKGSSFSAVLPAAASFGANPALTCPTTGIHGQIETIFRRDLGKKATLPAVADGRLCAMADTLLGWEPASEPPSDAVLAYLSAHFGLPAPARTVWINTFETEDVKQLAEQLQGSVAGFAATATSARWGLVTSRVKKGQTKAVLVLLDEQVQLDPLPRRLEPTGSARLNGSVAGDFDVVRVELATPAGEVKKVAGQGKSFSADLSCGGRSGRLLVEIVAEKDGNASPVATLPLACGGELPKAALLAADKAGPLDSSQAEAQLVEWINAERAQPGAAPLVVEAPLAAIARRLAQDRAEGKGLTSEDLLRSLKEAELSTPLVAVSAVQGLSLESAWSRLANTVHDRSTFLKADLTHVGAGVVAGPAAGGRANVIAFVIYIQELPPPDVGAIKARLFEAVTRRRSDARVSPLEKDPLLADVAQKYAEALASSRGKMTKEKDEELLAPVHTGYRTINLIGGYKKEPLDFAEEPGIVGQAKLLGVGVAVGFTPDLGRNSVFVEIIVATPPEAPAPPAKKPAKGKKK